MPREPIDVLVVGAGFAGLVTAERLCAGSGLKVVVVDRRHHLAGNAYDLVDAAGVVVHPYGPHYFRTNSPAVVDYLSRFTGWRPVEYTIKSQARGRLWSFPVNLTTYEQLVGRPATEEEFKAYLERVREPVAVPRNSEEVVVSQVGRELYELFYEGYTLKQWKRHPRELDPSVCGRIPIRTHRDERYLSEDFQALPDCGYTVLCERMVESSPGLRLLLGTTFEEAARHFSWHQLVFSGPLDAYFGYRCGRLPYRSLRFEMESFGPRQLQEREAEAGRPGFWQPVVQVNYPGADVPFTRIVEIKHATGQDTPNTTIVREHPAEMEATGEPYYPVPTPEARAMADRYREAAAAEARTTFIGRLGRYQYYNMDQVVAQALHESRKLAALARP